ncbi:MAG: hypothetical protein ACR2NP_12665, partial [Pirellulaceae bacterium]
MHAFRKAIAAGITAVASLVALSANECRAEMSIEIVSTERAQALGIEVRAQANGPNEVWVELEFKPEGELERFVHVSMEIRDGDKLLVGYAPMEAKRTSSGSIVCRCMVNRQFLEKVTLS